MRRIYAHDHAVGMLHYKARNFEAAAKRFEASFQAFSVHKRIDRLRWLLLGTAGQNSYRTMALLNLAFCHTQLGNGSKAVELYEQVLRETPDCAIAMVSLNMLNSMAAAGEHGKNA
jgi:tetratricopeptide (TPR) repeat protein